MLQCFNALNCFLFVLIFQQTESSSTDFNERARTEDSTVTVTATATEVSDAAFLKPCECIIGYIAILHHRDNTHMYSHPPLEQLTVCSFLTHLLRMKRTDSHLDWLIQELE